MMLQPQYKEELSAINFVSAPRLQTRSWRASRKQEESRFLAL